MSERRWMTSSGEPPALKYLQDKNKIPLNTFQEADTLHVSVNSEYIFLTINITFTFLIKDSRLHFKGVEDGWFHNVISAGEPLQTILLGGPIICV